MMKKLKVALIQMNATPYEFKANLQLALQLAQNACKQGAKLIVLPELFDNGYCVSDKDGEFALDFDKPHKHLTFKTLAEFAKENGVHLIACTIEKAGKKLYDTAFIISPKGKFVGKHRKIYLWNGEKKRFYSGKDYEIFALNFGEFKVQVGLQICYELGFGEGARILALKGAEILVYPSAFGKARAYNWDLLSKTRALENGCFVLACGLSGAAFDKNVNANLEFAGDSRVVSPKGEVLANASKLNECVLCEINLDEINAQRKALPYLKDFDTNLTKKAFEKI